MTPGGKQRSDVIRLIFFKRTLGGPSSAGRNLNNSSEKSDDGVKDIWTRTGQLLTAGAAGGGGGGPEWVGRAPCDRAPPGGAPPPSPLSCHRALALGFLCHTANSHRLSVLHTVKCMFQCCSCKSNHPLLPPLYPQVCSMPLLKKETVSQLCPTLCNLMD